MLDALRLTRTHPLGGSGFFAGDPPPDPNPDDYDGRTRVLNVPAPMRVVLLDGASRRPLAQTWSAADGTWRIDGVATDHRFALEFINDGQYTVTINAQVVPVNSFVQDWVFAQPYDED